MKKFLAVVLAAALALSLRPVAGAPASSTASAAGSTGGSTPASTQSYDYKIGVVTPSGDHGFTGESVAQANLMAEEMMEKYPRHGHHGTRFSIDAAAQIESIENPLAGGDVDMIILWPMEGGGSSQRGAQSIADAWRKLVVYDRLIEGFTADTFVGDIMGDNGIGKNMGEYLNEFFSDDDDVQYLRFVGDSSTVTSQRSEGMDGVLGDSFNQVAETLVTNWSTEECTGPDGRLAERTLGGRDRSPRLIVTHDDEIVDGIMNALMPIPAKLPSM